MNVSSVRPSALAAPETLPNRPDRAHVDPSASDVACPLDRSTPTESRLFLAGLLFFQMLPATGVAPAIRPLFAAQHAGREGAMHAFMAVNMLGAILVALAIVGIPAVRRRAPQWAAAAALLDGLVLIACTLTIPTSWVLGARMLEGALHVGVTTVLMSHAAELARQRGDRTLVTTAGAAIIFAVAGGSFLGGLLVGFDPRAPFWLGAALLTLVAVVLRPLDLVMARQGREGRSDEGPAAPSSSAVATAPARVRVLAAPLAAAFLARFAVGCLVVSFSLFAHRVHGLSDRHVGLLYACLTAPFALAMFPAGTLAKHRPNRWILASGMFTYAAAIASLGFVRAEWLPAPMLIAGVASALVFSSVLAFASHAPQARARTRAMALVNAAGCLGMLLGPAAGGIACAVFRHPLDPGRGYRAAFLVATVAIAMWVVATLPWLFRGAHHDSSTYTSKDEETE